MSTHNKCGVGINRCRDVSGRGPIPKRRQLSSLPPHPKRPVPGAEPQSPPTGKSPRLQAFGEEAFLQQECPPKSPRVNQPWPPFG